MLIDAPQSDARTLAVIAKARELRPDKPLTHVVNSHHHFDHSGAYGRRSPKATVIHITETRVYRGDVKRPTRRAPDALSNTRDRQD